MPYTPPPASAGGSALDANNNQVFPAALGVSTPAAGGVSERVLTRAGNSQFAFANADIPDILAMPSLENFSFCKMEANGNAALTAIGCQSFVSAATVTNRTNTTYSNSKDSNTAASTVTAGTAGYVMAQISGRARGNGPRRGGFSNVIRFLPTLLAGHQASVGMYQAIAPLAGEPSAEASSFVGMICDSADTNWQIFCKPSTAGTKIDTGLAKTATGAMLALYLYAPPNGTGISYQLENEETQAVVVSGTMTLTLPTVTQVHIGLGVRVRNGATTTIASMGLYSATSGSRY